MLPLCSLPTSSARRSNPWTKSYKVNLLALISDTPHINAIFTTMLEKFDMLFPQCKELAETMEKMTRPASPAPGPPYLISPVPTSPTLEKEKSLPTIKVVPAKGDKSSEPSKPAPEPTKAEPPKESKAEPKTETKPEPKPEAKPEPKVEPVKPAEGPLSPPSTDPSATEKRRSAGFAQVRPAQSTPQSTKTASKASESESDSEPAAPSTSSSETEEEPTIQEQEPEDGMTALTLAEGLDEIEVTQPEVSPLFQKLLALSEVVVKGLGALKPKVQYLIDNFSHHEESQANLELTAELLSAVALMLAESGRTVDLTRENFRIDHGGKKASPADATRLRQQALQSQVAVSHC